MLASTFRGDVCFVDLMEGSLPLGCYVVVVGGIDQLPRRWVGEEKNRIKSHGSLCVV